MFEVEAIDEAISTDQAWLKALLERANTLIAECEAAQPAFEKRNEDQKAGWAQYAEQRRSTPEKMARYLESIRAPAAPPELK